MRCGHTTWVNAVLVAASLLAQSNSYAASSTEKLSQLEQVDVYADRTLSQLRRDLVEAEDRFYAEYNELNDNDVFDVNCQRDPRTGSRLVLRICRAVYQEEAIRLLGAPDAPGASWRDDPGPRAGIQTQHALCGIAQPRVAKTVEGTRGSAGKTGSGAAAHCKAGCGTDWRARMLKRRLLPMPHINTVESRSESL
jgi:hypothetical protein